MTVSPKANKHLGQHFLINQGIIAKIADAVARLSRDTTNPVVEIGPGPGALTRELLARGFRVLAIEIDSRMREHLAQEFADVVQAGQLEIWDADATRGEYLARISALQKEGLCVCGNLPYNVGTQILFLLLEKATWASSFCFMLQKEVVQRLIHQEPGSKSYGVTGIKMAWMCDIGGHFWVKPGSFAPPPKVDSGVLWYTRKKPATLALQDYEVARDMVDLAFSQRRKMLKKTLPLAPEVFLTKRPDEITPADFLNLIMHVRKSPAWPL